MRMQGMNGYVTALNDALCIVDRSPFLFRIGNTYKHTVNRKRMMEFFSFLIQNVETVAYHGKDTEFICNKQGFVMVSEPYASEGRFIEDYTTGLQTVLNRITEWQGRMIKADVLAIIQHLREVC